MLLSYLSLALIAVLSSLLPPTSASPILAPRAQYCSNAPTVVAGNTFPRRSAPGPLDTTPLLPRDDNNYLWCVRGTATYLTLQPVRPLLGVALDAFITAAYNSVYAHLLGIGDGLLPDGSWKFQVGDLLLVVDNANNHQVSWGVLGSTIWGLRDFMTEMRFVGAVGFSVYEGAHLVGKGWVTQIRGG